MYTIEEARRKACGLFLNSACLRASGYGLNNALLDADVLISFLLKKERSWILSHREFDFSAFAAEFKALTEKRAAGIPAAYLTGTKDFFRHSFFVDRSVLIPKPDTETLVEKALAFIESEFGADCSAALKNGFYILDMCTGSGCIGISVGCGLYDFLINKTGLSKERVCTFFEKRVCLTLADISNEALTVCKKNAEKLLPKAVLRNTHILTADVKKKFPLINREKYKLIMANPPYVPTEMMTELLQDGRGEPELALDGGADGLDLIGPLAQNAFAALSDSGKMFTETGDYHTEAACRLFKRAGFRNTRIHTDLTDRGRVIEASK